jgi:hypothetical protein
VDDVARALLEYDQRARLRAIRLGRAIELVVGERELEMRPAIGRPTDDPMSKLRFAEDVQIVPVFPPGFEPEHERVILISRDGRSRSYGLQIVFGQVRQWIVVGGFAGRGMLVNDEQQIQNLLAAVGDARPDAD